MICHLPDIFPFVSSNEIVSCNGRKLNGAVSSPAQPRGSLLSFCSLASNCWQFSPPTDSTPSTRAPPMSGSGTDRPRDKKKNEVRRSYIAILSTDSSWHLLQVMRETQLNQPIR